MPTIEFDHSKGNKHECASKKIGDWIIYTCPHCPDYQRKQNIKTDEMKVRCDKNNHNLHSGSYVKPGLEGLYNPN